MTEKYDRYKYIEDVRINSWRLHIGRCVLLCEYDKYAQIWILMALPLEHADPASIRHIPVLRHAQY